MKYVRETSEKVCERMFMQINDVNFPLNGHGHVRVLEPSCGEGRIINYLHNNLSNYSKYHYTCVELNKNLLKKAEENLDFIMDHLIEFEQADFLLWGKHKREPFDLIVACPPFKDNIDLQHIKLMYDNLKPGGQMVTLTSPYWLTNNEAHQVEFRSWLVGKAYHLIMLPDNSFMEKNKSVPTAILKINRYI